MTERSMLMIAPLEETPEDVEYHESGHAIHTNPAAQCGSTDGCRDYEDWSRS